MKRHEDLRARLIRGLFSVYGPLDERAEHELGLICVNAALVLEIYVGIGFVAYLIAKATHRPDLISQYAFLVVLIGMFLFDGIVQQGVRRSGINLKEMTLSAYREMKKKIILHDVLWGIPFFCLSLVFWAAFGSNAGMSFVDSLFDWRYSVIAIATVVLIEASKTSQKLSCVRIVDETDDSAKGMYDRA